MLICGYVVWMYGWGVGCWKDKNLVSIRRMVYCLGEIEFTLREFFPQTLVMTLRIKVAVESGEKNMNVQFVNR